MKILSFLFLFMVCGNCFSQDENLLWSDEFNGVGAPDSTYWSYELGATGYGNNEIQNYTNLLANSRQENGTLIIEAHKKGDEWTSARLISKDKFNFTYGRIVFRAKLPTGFGTWPALWMLGQNINEVGWPECGEIDVMEHVGRRPGVVQAAMHTPSSHGNTLNVGFTDVPDFDTEYHLYEANWTKEKIEFSVDGLLFYTYFPAIKDNDTWPFEKPQYIIMNIAMGGNFGSYPEFESDGLKNGIDPELSKARMEIDYVRVYKNEDSR
jgi:beta-glucanase (GH16 family)